MLARRRMFGASSEQSPDQVCCSNEAEVLAAMPPADEDADTDASDEATDGGKAPQVKARGKRAPLPAELPRVDIVHELPEAERVCACGTPMVEIGEEISEQLDIVPMKIQVLRHIRKRYGCPRARPGAGDRADAGAADPQEQREPGPDRDAAGGQVH